MSVAWADAAALAGIVVDGRIDGLSVHACDGVAKGDAVLCPSESVRARLRSMERGGRAERVPNAQRLFMSRSLRHDADTAAAAIVRAVIGKWTAMRRQREVSDPVELRTLTMVEAHLRRVGFEMSGAVLAGDAQIADPHVSPPVSSIDEMDVAAKAVAQFVRQLDGRYVVISERGPMAG